MERPTCKTCPYWKQLPEAKAYGECRHGPAKHGHETELRCDPGTVNITWGNWFDQHEDEWCGCHPDFPAYIASLKKPSVAPDSNGETWLQYQSELDVRSRKTLRKLGKMTIEEIANVDPFDILSIKNCGQTTIRSILGFLRNHGYNPDWRNATGIEKRS